MIPSESKTFRISDLAAGREYELCVLAIYDDGITSLTATRVVGCVHFRTAPEASQCRFVHSQFLGGTMIIIIGGVIVASVLVFIVILMIRYKAYDGVKAKTSTNTNAGNNASASIHGHSQTNGSRSGRPGSKQQQQQGGEERTCRRDSQAGTDCKALVLLSLESETQEEFKVQLPMLSPDAPVPSTSAPISIPPASRRGSLGNPPSEDTQTDSSLTGSTMSLCLIGSRAGEDGPTPRPRDGRKGALGGMGLLPGELARTRHRFSFDGDYALFQSHSYPRRARTRRHKSSTNLNSDASPPASRRVTFSSTEWMLESTV